MLRGKCVTKPPGTRLSARGLVSVDDTGIEPATSSVSGKRSPAELIVRGSGAGPELRADDGIRTRDPHLGKVMLYQLSHVRMLPGCFIARSLQRPGDG